MVSDFESVDINLEAQRWNQKCPFQRAGALLVLNVDSMAQSTSAKYGQADWAENQKVLLKSQLKSPKAKPQYSE